jgi:hypothetical protein
MNFSRRHWIPIERDEEGREVPLNLLVFNDRNKGWFGMEDADIGERIPPWHRGKDGEDMRVDHGTSIPGEVDADGNVVPEGMVELNNGAIVPEFKGVTLGNPKDSIGRSKAPLAALPVVAQVWGSLGMAEGMRKYGEKNYRYANVQASVYTSGIRRHLSKWEEGQETDLKTKVHHLGSVIAGAAILLDAQLHGSLIDDRHKEDMDKLEELFATAQEVVNNLDELFGSDTRLLEDRD